MNRYKKLLSNTGLIALGNFGSKLIVFFMVRFYTSCLTPAQYGTADLLMDAAKLLMPVLCVGITESVFRFGMEDEESCSKKDVFTLGLCTVLGGSVLYVIVLPLLGLSSDFRPYLPLIAGYVLCANLHAMVSYYIRTRDHFRFYAIQGILNTALVVGFNLLFLLGFGRFEEFKVDGYVLSVVLADLLCFLLIFVREKLWTELKDPRRIDRGTAKAMFRYCIPLIPTTIFWWITSVSDRFMVRYMVGETEQGLYTAANKIPTVISMLCTIFIQAWNFSSVAEKEEGERSRFFTTTFACYSGLLFSAGAAVILFSRLGARILFAADFFTAWRCIPILTMATVFSGFVTFVGSIYTVRKKSLAAFRTAAVGAGVNLLLNAVLIPSSLFGLPMANLGAIGAAIATVCSYFTVFLIRALSAKRYVAFRLGAWRLILSTLLLSLMAGVMIFAIPAEAGALAESVRENLLAYGVVFAAAAGVVAINLLPLLRGIQSIIHNRGVKK